MTTRRINDKDLRQTILCPCYKLARGIAPGDTFPDHICQRTMQESCFQYLKETGIAALSFSGAPVIFSVPEAGLVTLENAWEWPWTVQGDRKSVLMVLQQVVEHKPSSRTMAALQAHPDWPAAKRSLHEVLQLSAKSYCVQDWKLKNSGEPEDPEALSASFDALIKSLEPETLGFDGDDLPNAEDGSCVIDLAAPRPQWEPPPRWPPPEGLRGPTGLSKPQQIEFAQSVLQQYNLTNTAASVRLLLSEVLPADYKPPTAKEGVPKSVTVVSFLLGNLTPAFTASMFDAETQQIEMQEWCDPDGAESRRRSLFNRGNFPLLHGGEALFQINGSADWARNDTIKDCISAKTAHKEWWIRQATRPRYETDGRNVPRKQSFAAELDEDDKTEVQKDIESHLAGAMVIDEVYARAYRRDEEDAGKKLTAPKKSEIRDSVNRKIRDKKDQRGIPRKRNRSAKSA